MKLNANHIANLKVEQQYRAERIAQGLDTEGCWFIAGSLLGWMRCDEEYITKVIKEFEETKQ